MTTFSTLDLSRIGHNLSLLILATIAAFIAEILLLYGLSKKNNKNLINIEESKKDLWIFFGNMLLNFFIYDAVYLSALAIMEQYQPWRIPTQLWTFPLALAVVDLSYYWMHRYEHKNNFAWAVHGVHHSCKQIKFSAAVRVSWLFRIYAWVALMPAVILGFHPVLAYVCYKFILFYQICLHNEYISKLGLLEKIFITPSHHRVHHGMNEKYLDKNFATIFIFWDKIFGTFQKEEEKPIYGAHGFVESSNPWVLVFQPVFRALQGYKWKKRWYPLKSPIDHASN